MPERELVTIVEVLSPTNKRPGEGRRRYIRKRETIVAGLVNLVEIDLLRRWEPMPLETPPRPAITAFWCAGAWRALAPGCIPSWCGSASPSSRRPCVRTMRRPRRRWTRPHHQRPAPHRPLRPDSPLQRPAAGTGVCAGGGRVGWGAGGGVSCAAIIRRPTCSCRPRSGAPDDCILRQHKRGQGVGFCLTLMRTHFAWKRQKQGLPDDLD